MYRKRNAGYKPGAHELPSRKAQAAYIPGISYGRTRPYFQRGSWDLLACKTSTWRWFPISPTPIMSLDRVDIECHPLIGDREDVSILRPQKRRQASARVFERFYVPALFLVGLVVGLGFGRIGANYPANFSYNPVSTIFDSFVDM